MPGNSNSNGSANASAKGVTASGSAAILVKYAPMIALVITGLAFIFLSIRLKQMYEDGPSMPKKVKVLGILSIVISVIAFALAVIQFFFF